MKKITTGILAHVDAGKTTLSEAILYLTGTIRRLGRVDHRDAFFRYGLPGKRPGDHDIFKTGGNRIRRYEDNTAGHTGTC